LCVYQQLIIPEVSSVANLPEKRAAAVCAQSAIDRRLFGNFYPEPETGKAVVLLGVGR
jgi:hypothetical protein